jgi:S-adenosylmethionine-dependent methyltransferase
MSSPDAFDDKVESWKEHQHTPWSRLYYSISRANLSRHLPKSERPLHFLDVGSGNGLDSIYYAQQGHRITLIDHSPAMLEEARARAVAAGVDDQASYHLASVAEIPSLLSAARFDVVLCHGVAHYVEDLASLLRCICHPLRSGGMLSLISINRYSEPYREALLWRDMDAAQARLNAQTAESSVFGTSIRLRTARQVIDQLDEGGCTLVSQYGVRCVNDYISDNDIKHDPVFFRELERLEKAISGQYPYYLLARDFQIIARRSPAT